jgi:UDP-N-acetylmuramate--alanine ligase
MPKSSFPLAGRHLHFVGAGGCGMSGLALIARDLGAEVSGSDAKATIFTQSLGQAGMPVRISQDAGNVPDGPRVEIVYSSAVKPENPERIEARRRGLGELHRSALLAEISSCFETVAVGGAHGKSTTAALLAHVLAWCGKDPSYVVGALMRPPGVHAMAGDGDMLVIEADESDRSLLSYQVQTAVITSVDLDHVGDGGAYADVSDVARVLGQFASAAGEVVVSAQAAGHLRPFVPDVEMTVADPELLEGAGRFALEGEVYETNLPGAHQARNAALVVHVARSYGCSPEDIRTALLSFPGLARRFELRGKTQAGARVIDDYAHHPAEVAAVLAAARQVAGEGRVIAVFQPHLFSRTERFAAEFLTALEGADEAWVEPVYPAREDPQDWEHVVKDLASAVEQRYPRVQMSPGRPGLAAYLGTAAGSQDVVLLAGAGDVSRLADILVC